MKVLKLKLADFGLVTVIAVMVLTMLISTADTSYNIRVLSSEQMRSISGGGCSEQCTFDAGLRYYCDCAQLGEHWTVCSVSKNVKQCEDKPTGTCVDKNKYASATGSSYEDYEMTDWHKCNYASYCDNVNWDGVNYICSNTCYTLYYGCN